MSTNRRPVLFSLVASLSLAIATGKAQGGALAISVFEIDSEGWSIAGDGTGPTFQAAGGNPGGHITTVDQALGVTWYWNAPVKFLGDQTSAYGGMLSFDLFQSSTSSPFNAADVILIGNSSQQVSHDFGDSSTHPGTDWTPYQLVLNETTFSTDTSTLQGILGDLEALRIRGEYRSGADSGGLDNVVLENIPEPSALWLLATVLAAVVVRHRSPGFI